MGKGTTVVMIQLIDIFGRIIRARKGDLKERERALERELHCLEIATSSPWFSLVGPVSVHGARGRGLFLEFPASPAIAWHSTNVGSLGRVATGRGGPGAL